MVRRLAFTTVGLIAVFLTGTWLLEAFLSGSSNNWSLAVESMASLSMVLLTASLVGVTVFYAVQTRSMVNEMRSARTASALPRIYPSIRHLPAGHGFPEITNVGVGTALDVEVTLEFQPDGPTKSWRAPVVGPRDSHAFFIPYPANEGNADRFIGKMDEWARLYPQLTMSATYQDAFGNEYSVSESLDIAKIWEMRKAADHIWRDDPKDAFESIAKGIKMIEKSLSSK